MITYLIIGDFVQVYIEAPEGRGDGEVLRTHSGLPEWIKTAPDGLYTENGDEVK